MSDDGNISIRRNLSLLTWNFTTRKLPSLLLRNCSIINCGHTSYQLILLCFGRSTGRGHFSSRRPKRRLNRQLLQFNSRLRTLRLQAYHNDNHQDNDHHNNDNNDYDTATWSVKLTFQQDLFSLHDCWHIDQSHLAAKELLWHLTICMLKRFCRHIDCLASLIFRGICYRGRQFVLEEELLRITTIPRPIPTLRKFPQLKILPIRVQSQQMSSPLGTKIFSITIRQHIILTTVIVLSGRILWL